MRSFRLWAPFLFVAGCDVYATTPTAEVYPAGTYVSSDYGYYDPYYDPGFAFGAPPPLVTIYPGIQIVPNLGYEVFYTNGYYWTRAHDRWYRTGDWHGGWAVAAPPVPLTRMTPGSYRNWHGGGHPVVVRPPVQRPAYQAAPTYRAPPPAYRAPAPVQRPAPPPSYSPVVRPVPPPAHPAAPPPAMRPSPSMPPPPAMRPSPSIRPAPSVPPPAARPVPHR